MLSAATHLSSTTTRSFAALSNCLSGQGIRSTVSQGVCQQLSHASGERHFLRLAAGQQVLIEALDDGVVADGREGGHIESRPNMRTSTPDLAPAAEQAAVSIQGGYTY